MHPGDQVEVAIRRKPIQDCLPRCPMANDRCTSIKAQHKLLQKSHNLYKEQQGPLSPGQQHWLVTLDRVKNESMIHAEKTSRHLCMGEVDFSLNINEVRGQCFVWQMIINYQSGKKESSEKIC
jgi:hypothetical protein